MFHGGNFMHCTFVFVCTFVFQQKFRDYLKTETWNFPLWNIPRLWYCTDHMAGWTVVTSWCHGYDIQFWAILLYIVYLQTDTDVYTCSQSHTCMHACTCWTHTHAHSKVLLKASKPRGSVTSYKSCTHSQKSFKNLCKSLNLCKSVNLKSSYFQHILYSYCNFSYFVITCDT